MRGYGFSAWFADIHNVYILFNIFSIFGKASQAVDAEAVGAMAGLKRMARFLKRQPRLVRHFVRQRPGDRMTVVSKRCLDGFANSDFAGCLATMKSTSAVILMIGQHCLKTMATTQTVQALSSGEAEYYSLVKLC